MPSRGQPESPSALGADCWWLGAIAALLTTGADSTRDKGTLIALVAGIVSVGAGAVVGRLVRWVILSTG